jgi:hypothetical protein
MSEPSSNTQIARSGWDLESPAPSLELDPASAHIFSPPLERFRSFNDGRDPSRSSDSPRTTFRPYSLCFRECSCLLAGLGSHGDAAPETQRYVHPLPDGFTTHKGDIYPERNANSGYIVSSSSLCQGSTTGFCQRTPTMAVFLRSQFLLRLVPRSVAILSL